MFISVYSWFSFLFCNLLISCVITYRPVVKTSTKFINAINPDSIAPAAFFNLRNQSSFSYKYEFKSNLPHDVVGKFKGRVVFPLQEEREGCLIRNNKKTNFKIRARGSYQYDISKITNKWQVIPRDVDTDIMMMVERTITNATYCFLNEDKQSYIYSFSPNLAFLDPTFTRKINARLTVDKKTGLPQQITAQDSTKQIFWHIEFDNFNNRTGIKFPFLPNTKITLESETALSKVQISRVIKVLKNRLELAGENFRLNSKNVGNNSRFIINLEIPQQDPDYRLLKTLVISQGKVGIYPKNESIPLVDKSDIGEIKIVSYEPYPTIEITLNQTGIKKMNEYLKLSDAQTFYKIFIDSRDVATFSIDKSNFSDKILFQVLTNINEIMNTISILKGGTFAVPLRIVNIETNR